MRVPAREAICAISKEAVACIEEDEPIPGTQLPDQVWDIMLENRPCSFGIEPNSDVLRRHAEVLKQNLSHCSRVGLSKLNRTDSSLLVGLNSDQDGMCRSHWN